MQEPSKQGGAQVPRSIDFRLSRPLFFSGFFPSCRLLSPELHKCHREVLPIAIQRRPAHTHRHYQAGQAFNGCGGLRYKAGARRYRALATNYWAEGSALPVLAVLLAILSLHTSQRHRLAVQVRNV